MDDLISRAAAIAKIKEARKAARTLTGKDFVMMLERQPAVDAAPVVHGRWVDEEGNPVPMCDTLPSSPAFSCWCNQCGTWLVASDEYPVYGLFCPVCGAKMDGGAEL